MVAAKVRCCVRYFAGWSSPAAPLAGGMIEEVVEMLHRLLFLVLVVAILGAGAVPAVGAVAEWLGPNTSFCVGTLPPAAWWADAYYVYPDDYGDWTVGGGGYIDGNASFIWLREPGQWAQTTLGIGSTSVVVGFGSDDNDGRVEILIDGSSVAIIDSWSTPGIYWYIQTWELPPIVHTIEVWNLGATQQPGGTPYDDDTSLDGAGILPCTPIEEASWGRIKALFGA